MARIPKDASIGQLMIAEQSCWRDENERKPIQAVPGARRTGLRGPGSVAMGHNSIIKERRSVAPRLGPRELLLSNFDQNWTFLSGISILAGSSVLQTEATPLA